MKIRIPVAIGTDGEWFAYGASKQLGGDAATWLGKSHHPTIVYVEAEVEVPVEKVVEGKVCAA